MSAAAGRCGRSHPGGGAFVRHLCPIRRSTVCPAAPAVSAAIRVTFKSWAGTHPVPCHRKACSVRTNGYSSGLIRAIVSIWSLATAKLSAAFMKTAPKPAGLFGPEVLNATRPVAPMAFWGSEFIRSPSRKQNDLPDQRQLFPGAFAFSDQGRAQS